MEKVREKRGREEDRVGGERRRKGETVGRRKD